MIGRICRPETTSEGTKCGTGVGVSGITAG
jgi:hypothetical protein